MKMTPERFAELAQQGYNRIPVMREVLADLDTPLSTYLKLAHGRYTYLLESVQGGEKWGRYSIIGLPCRTVLKVSADQVRVETDGQLVEESRQADPLAFVEQFQARYRVPELEGLPRFNGGLVGYFGYDTVRYIEPRLSNVPKDELGTPDILLMVSDQLVVFDNLSGRLMLICHADPAEDNAFDQAQQQLDRLVGRLRGAVPQDDTAGQRQQVLESDFQPGFAEADFKAAVNKIKEYILAGDVMQTVIAQRMSIPFEARPVDLYRALRMFNPSPYMYLLNLGEFQVVGSSPEILARLEDGEVTVRPIAGTRKRGKNEEQDLAMERELLADPKEIAEHLMLIDLGRND
jgi:anthranilate synthase component 1